VATAIGTTIISERFMKAEERSVEVIEKLGVAGERFFQFVALFCFLLFHVE
jgi:hypothetical protein